MLLRPTYGQENWPSLIFFINVVCQTLFPPLALADGHVSRCRNKRLSKAHGIAKTPEAANSLAHEVRHTDSIPTCGSTPVSAVVQFTYLFILFSRVRLILEHGCASPAQRWVVGYRALARMGRPTAGVISEYESSSTSSINGQHGYPVNRRKGAHHQSSHHAKGFSGWCAPSRRLLTA